MSWLSTWVHWHYVRNCFEKEILHPQYLIWRIPLPKKCQYNKKHLQHLSRRRGGARFKVFCNFETGVRRQQPRRHLLAKIHFFIEIILHIIFRIFEFLIFRQGMSILKKVFFRLFQWEHSPFCLRVAEWNHAVEVCADGLTSLKSHWKKNYTVL